MTPFGVHVTQLLGVKPGQPAQHVLTSVTRVMADILSVTQVMADILYNTDTLHRLTVKYHTPPALPYRFQP